MLAPGWRLQQIERSLGLAFVIPGTAVLILRIRDEEKLLNRELAGYTDYIRQVRYRMLPYVW